MEKLLPTGCGEPLEYVPKSYIQPDERRPGNAVIPLCKDIPRIDLAEAELDRGELVKKIIRAGQEFGIIFLNNHGISEDLIRKMLCVAKEFHELPDKDKASMYSEDRTKICSLYTSLDYNNEKVHFWRNILVHRSCNPEAKNSGCFPEKPAEFREVAGEYAVEFRRVLITLVELICEGLGIDAGHYRHELTKVQKLAMNYYPRCPDPSRVLGLAPHDDINPLTVLIEHSEYPGYQILRNGQWLGVAPPENSLIVNFGFTLEMISNGKIKGGVHRVVLHEKLDRVAVAGSIHPAGEFYVEPAKELIDESHPLRYKSSLYKDLHARRSAGFCDGQEAQYNINNGGGKWNHGTT
ncbi:unnamed protein product [Rhodiola kirilowii]